MASEIRSEILVGVDSLRDKIVGDRSDKCPEDLAEAGRSIVHVNLFLS